MKKIIVLTSGKVINFEEGMYLEGKDFFGHDRVLRKTETYSSYFDKFVPCHHFEGLAVKIGETMEDLIDCIVACDLHHYEKSVILPKEKINELEPKEGVQYYGAVWTENGLKHLYWLSNIDNKWHLLFEIEKELK